MARAICIDGTRGRGRYTETRGFPWVQARCHRIVATPERLMAATIGLAQRRFQRHVWLAAIALALLLIGMVLALRTMSTDRDTQERLRHALAITDGAFDEQHAATELQRHMALAAHLPTNADDSDGAAGLLRESLSELQQHAQHLQLLDLTPGEGDQVESVVQATRALSRLLGQPAIASNADVNRSSAGTATTAMPSVMT